MLGDFRPCWFSPGSHQYYLHGVQVTKKRSPNHLCLGKIFPVCDRKGKNNGFPFLDILGYLKNTYKNPKFGKVGQIPTREFPTKFPNWDLSHFAKFGIFMGIL